MFAIDFFLYFFPRAFYSKEMNSYLFIFKNSLFRKVFGWRTKRASLIRCSCLHSSLGSLFCLCFVISPSKNISLCSVRVVCRYICLIWFFFLFFFNLGDELSNCSKDEKHIYLWSFNLPWKYGIVNDFLGLFYFLLFIFYSKIDFISTFFKTLQWKFYMFFVM